MGCVGMGYVSVGCVWVWCGVCGYGVRECGVCGYGICGCGVCGYWGVWI